MKKVAIISLGINFLLVIGLIGQVIINTNKNIKIDELQGQVEKNESNNINSNTNTSEIVNNNKKEETKNKKVDNTTDNFDSRKDIEECINNFFNTMYNYKNDNYVERFTKAKEYAKDDVITQMKGTSGEQATAPTTKVQSTVSNLKVYYATDSTIVVVADMNYKIENLNGNNFRQVMQIGVIKEDDKYLIDQFKIISTGAAE